MKKIPFWKTHGAGNDFILVDSRSFRGSKSRGSREKAFAKRYCTRVQGIGADGLLVLEKTREAPRLRYYNADGSRAFCGNGARCAAAWVHARRWVRGKAFDLSTDSGMLRAESRGSGRFRVAMPRPSAPRLSIPIRLPGKSFRVDWLNTGVPHVVSWVRSVRKADVSGEGRALRRHRRFAPEGANVNFVEDSGRGLRLRTFERGVEAETLACGTGIVAAALLHAKRNPRLKSVRVRPLSGESLTVTFRREDSPRGFTDVALEGPTKFIYTGSVSP